MMSPIYITGIVKLLSKPSISKTGFPNLLSLSQLFHNTVYGVRPTALFQAKSCWFTVLPYKIMDAVILMGNNYQCIRRLTMQKRITTVQQRDSFGLYRCKHASSMCGVCPAAYGQVQLCNWYRKSHINFSASHPLSVILLRGLPHMGMTYEW